MMARQSATRPKANSASRVAETWSETMIATTTQSMRRAQFTPTFRLAPRALMNLSGALRKLARMLRLILAARRARGLDKQLLASLSARDLADIGLGRAPIDFRNEKPSWRA